MINAIVVIMGILLVFGCTNPSDSLSNNSNTAKNSDSETKTSTDAENSPTDPDNPTSSDSNDDKDYYINEYGIYIFKTILKPDTEGTIKVYENNNLILSKNVTYQSSANFIKFNKYDTETTIQITYVEGHYSCALISSFSKNYKNEIDSVDIYNIDDIEINENNVTFYLLTDMVEVEKKFSMIISSNRTTIEGLSTKLIYYLDYYYRKTDSDYVVTSSYTQSTPVGGQYQTEDLDTSRRYLLPSIPSYMFNGNEYLSLSLNKTNGEIKVRYIFNATTHGIISANLEGDVLTVEMR